MDAITILTILAAGYLTVILACVGWCIFHLFVGTGGPKCSEPKTDKPEVVVHGQGINAPTAPLPNSPAWCPRCGVKVRESYLPKYFELPLSSGYYCQQALREKKQAEE